MTNLFDEFDIDDVEWAVEKYLGSSIMCGAIFMALDHETQKKVLESIIEIYDIEIVRGEG